MERDGHAIFQPCFSIASRILPKSFVSRGFTGLIARLAS